MTVADLKKMLKEGKVSGNVFLLFGEEVFLRDHYCKQLKELLKPEAMEELNVFSFSGKNYDIAAVDEAIEALPVFADKKLLLFSDSKIFKLDGRSGATAEYRSYWEKRLKDIPENVYLIFSEDEIDKRSALYKYVAKNQTAAEYSYLKENEMIQWTVGLFRTLGKSISPFCAKYLVEITDSGMLAVKREAEKLAAYVQEGVEVTRKEIDALVTPSIENKVFVMIDALIAKDADTALRRLADLFTMKEDANRILGAVIYNVDKLIGTKLLMEQGADKSEIMSKLKIAPFQVGKYMRDCNKYQLTELSALMKRCVKTDAYLKSNSMDNNTLLELMMFESL